MHESDTYQAILDEGEAMAARKHILVIGEVRVGPPPESAKDLLNSITDPDRLERMHRRAIGAVSWQEILDTP